MELFIPIKFKSSIQLMPNELNNNFHNTILQKLKNNLESVCSKHGYIKKDSIKIIKRSVGCLIKQSFNGNILFNLECIAEICNPAQGSIIKCNVKAKNSLGVLAVGHYNNIPILEIIIPKISAGIQSEINIDKINIGDEIKVEVIGKKFQLFDKHISIIGKAIKNKNENIKNDISDNIYDIDVPDEPDIDIDIEKPLSDIIEDDDDDDDISKKNKDDDDEEEELDFDNEIDDLDGDIEDNIPDEEDDF